MHSVIKSGLEDYLAGAVSGEFRAHLSVCVKCREEVEQIRMLSGMLGTLRVGALPDDAPVVPPLGFSSRVIRNIRQESPRSAWSFLFMDSAFTRRLALASLVALGVLGSYLATGGDDPMVRAEKTPEAVMTSHDIYSANDDQHRDGMLVTLATYRQ